MDPWNDALEREMNWIIERGSWTNPGTRFARFAPEEQDAQRFYELVELKAQHYWEEYKNAGERSD